MRQIPDSAKEAQESINTSADNSKSVTSAIMIGNLILGVGLQRILEMINALQIIILLPLIKSNIPANASMFFARLLEIAAFDIFEIGEFVNDYLSLEQTDPINERYEASGLESKYFINNLGTFFLILIVYFFFTLLWLVVSFARKWSDCKCLKLLDKKLHRSLFWNGLIAVVFESYLMVSLCAFIAIQNSFSFRVFGQSFQTICLLAIMTVYIVIPFFVLLVVIRRFEQLQNVQVKRRFGLIYRGLNLKYGRIVTLWPLYYLVRRLYLPYVVVFGTGVFIYQMV